MTNIQTVFQEAQNSTTLNPTDQIGLFLIFTHINKMLQRQKIVSAPMPPIEAICEVLVMKAGVTDIINKQSLVIVDDITNYFTG